MKNRIFFTIAFLFAALLSIAQAQPKLRYANEVPGTITVFQDDAHASFTLNGDTLTVNVPGFDMSIQEQAILTAAYEYGETLCGCIQTVVDGPEGEPALWIYWADNAAVVHIPEIGATYFIGSERNLLSVPEPMCHKVFSQNHEINAGTRKQYTFRDK